MWKNLWKKLCSKFNYQPQYVPPRPVYYVQQKLPLDWPRQM